MSEFPGNKIRRGNPSEKGLGDGVERPGRTRQLVFKSKSREEEATEKRARALKGHRSAFS